MTSHLLYRIAAVLVAFALAQPAFAETFTVQSVPSGLEVPAGNTLFLSAEATGTQNYVCLPAGTGFSWTFFGPQATLFINLKVGQLEIRQQVTTHFLSPNPDEQGTPRPTWQGSIDSSAVWGRAIASSNDPKFVAPGAIPWLLVAAVGTEAGPTHGTFLSQTTFIQRVNTSGGVAPSTGCSQSGNVGATALVPYRTDYLFYKATN